MPIRHDTYTAHVYDHRKESLRVRAQPDLDALQDEDAWQHLPHEILVWIDGADKPNLTLTAYEAYQLSRMLLAALRAIQSPALADGEASGGEAQASP